MSKTFALVTCNLAGWHIYRGNAPAGIGADYFADARLVLEPENPVDPNAVLFMRGNIKLGYVPASIAPLVSTLMRNGYTLTPRCVEVAGGKVVFELLMPSL
jgi:hypothetical protein